MLLEHLGNEVRVAYDGQQALDLAATYAPDMALLDIGMPRMDGFEVARRIRGLPDGSSIVLAALTGWGQAEDRRRSREAGFDYHLVKPLDRAALEQLLAEQARRAR